MRNEEKNIFGNLIKQKKDLSDLNKIFEDQDKHLDYLFQSYYKDLNNLSVFLVERKRAMENLNKLTQQLQTERLHINSKEKCKYFTL